MQRQPWSGAYYEAGVAAYLPAVPAFLPAPAVGLERSRFRVGPSGAMAGPELRARRASGTAQGVGSHHGPAPRAEEPPAGLAWQVAARCASSRRTKASVCTCGWCVGGCGGVCVLGIVWFVWFLWVPCSDAIMCVGNEKIAFLANVKRTAEGVLVKNLGAKGPKLSRLVMPQRLFGNNPNLLVDRKGLSPIVSQLRRRLGWSRWLSGLIILNVEVILNVGVISGFGDRL